MGGVCREALWVGARHFLFSDRCCVLPLDGPALGHSAGAHMPQSRLDHFILVNIITIIMINTTTVVVSTATADIIIRIGLEEPDGRKTGGWMEAQRLTSVSRNTNC